MAPQAAVTRSLHCKVTMRHEVAAQAADPAPCSAEHHTVWQTPQSPPTPVKTPRQQHARQCASPMAETAAAPLQLLPMPPCGLSPLPFSCAHSPWHRWRPSTPGPTPCDAASVAGDMSTPSTTPWHTSRPCWRRPGLEGLLGCPCPTHWAQSCAQSPGAQHPAQDTVNSDAQSPPWALLG